MKLLSWVTTKAQKGKTLEQLLRSEYGLSRRQLTRLKKQRGSVLINGQPVPVGVCLELEDYIEIIMEEHLGTVPPEDIPLEVIYEDQDITVVNKPGGLVSHPTKGYASGTLANALSHYWGQRGIQRPIRLVTRLDRETSGIVLAANNAWAHHRLSETVLGKEYLAITQGIPQPSQGQIDAPIGRSRENPNKRGVDPLGKLALTRYRIEGTSNGLALVRLWPVTGRTHQLRIHMAHIGCPLVDDFMYGREEGLVGRVALHACRLEFSHPATGRTILCKAPTPEDIGDLLKKLGI